MVGCIVAVMEKRFELKNKRFSFARKQLVAFLERQVATVRMRCSNADNFKTTR